jgi:(+)-pinoresinol hydroxylase
MGSRKVLLVLIASASWTVAAAADPPALAAWTTQAVVATPGMPEGYAQFQNKCAICHGKGPARPGTRALEAKYAGKLPAPLEDRTDLAPEFIKYTVRHGVSVMPPFRKTELSDADLNAIAKYLTRQRK